MQWNDHSRLVGQHAFLGASKYHWLNYDTQRLVDAFMSCQAKEKGTRLHAFAAECINLKQKLPKSKKTLNAYVNDAIGFRMDPEQVLFYSENCFGICAYHDEMEGHENLHSKLICLSIICVVFAMICWCVSCL